MDSLQDVFGILLDAWITIASLAALLLLWSIATIGSRPKGCPPGPPTLPIVGNLLSLPKKDIHLAYLQWREKYGPIFSLQLGAQTAIVVTSGAVVKAMMDKKSSNYSDRPHLYMQDIWEDSRIIMRSYDDLWKVERKLYHQFLNSNIATKYEPYQTTETTKLLYDLLKDPSGFEKHVSRTTASLSASMTYGFRIGTPESEVLKAMMNNAHGFFKLVHKYRFFDYYPILRSIAKILPLALNPVAKKATQLYHSERTFFKRLYEEAIDKSIANPKLPSFAADIATAQRTWKSNELLTEQAASYIAGIAFEGGADTTRNTLLGFIKAMVLFQDAQKLAQKELDEVVGADRLPTMDDFMKLPYVRATVKETLRWFPTGINGAMPHASRSNDEFEGYKIPKGATVILAVWSCNNDTKLFDDPRTFNPGRQLVDLSVGEDAIASDYHKRSSWSFGAARRLCPGIHVAERTLFLTIARILWAFDISTAVDEKGQAIFVERDAVTQSIAACPLPFKCVIKPRSEKRRMIIEKEMETVDTLFDADGNYKDVVLRR